MKENALKILFSGTVLSLMFWGQMTNNILPALRPNQVVSTSTVPPISAVFENHIVVPPPSGGDRDTVANLSGTETAPENDTVNNDKKTPISIQASLYLIGDIDSEANITEFNARKRWPIASLTKLMTAAVVLEHIPKDGKIEISDAAIATEGVSGGLTKGEVMTRDDLLRAITMVSSNDAASAVAEHLGREKFMALMNSKAVSLGMTNTYFREPTGLSPLNQSTANDLKLLARYIYRSHPEILVLSRLENANITDIKTGKVISLKNINALVGRADFIGGKTGYTNDSGENLISLFARAQKIVVVIVLDATDRYRETLSGLAQYDKL